MLLAIFSQTEYTHVTSNQRNKQNIVNIPEAPSVLPSYHQPFHNGNHHPHL